MTPNEQRFPFGDLEFVLRGGCLLVNTKSRHCVFRVARIAAAVVHINEHDPDDVTFHLFFKVKMPSSLRSHHWLRVPTSPRGDILQFLGCLADAMGD